MKTLLVVAMLYSPSTLAQTVPEEQLPPKGATLRVPTGKSNSAFTMSDTIRDSEPKPQNTATLIQVSKQDSINFTGLFELPMPSLIDVTMRLDYLRQLRLLRYGMLMVNKYPETAKMYGAKLYLLSDEIFVNKLKNDSLQQKQVVLKLSAHATPPKAESTAAIQPAIEKSTSSSVSSFLTVFSFISQLGLVVLAGLFLYDRYFNTKTPILFAKK